MAFDCVNASLQHFTMAAPNITVPPATFSVWINMSSLVAANSALFHWRGSIETGLILRYVAPSLHLRYYVSAGPEWVVNTGHTLSTGVWQHACLSLAPSQARVYLGGAGFTNYVSHGSATLNATGYLGRDPYPDANHTSFNGALAEPAMWNVALSDAECLALSNGISPLALTDRLPNLVMYHDLIRDVNRGLGVALTAVNAPSPTRHPPMRCRPSSRPLRFPTARFQSPYRPAGGVADAGRVIEGCALTTGSEAGVTLPYGEVSS